MRAFHRILPVAALAFLSIAAQATTTLYPSASTFAASIAPGAYTENFDGLADPPPGAAPFSGAGYSYTVSAPNDIFLETGFLGTSQIEDTLTISFTGRPVTAIGANFFAVDYSDAYQTGSITLTLSDGTATTFQPGSATDSFEGFTSDVAITSLVVTGPGGSLYVAVDNLTVGTAASAVPEPAGGALMVLGSAALLAAARRRKS